MKKQFTPKEKAEITLAALKEQMTIAQISSTYEVHPTQVNAWKKQAREGMLQLFTDKRKKENQTQEQLIGELYKIIGQRDAQLEWLKKKLGPFNTPWKDCSGWKGQLKSQYQAASWSIEYFQIFALLQTCPDQPGRHRPDEFDR